MANLRLDALCLPSKGIRKDCTFDELDVPVELFGEKSGAVKRIVAPLVVAPLAKTHKAMQNNKLDFVASLFISFHLEYHSFNGKGSALLDGSVFSIRGRVMAMILRDLREGPRRQAG